MSQENSIEMLFNKETAEEIAKNIVNNFGETNENRSLDCDFHLRQGVFESGDVNTWFKMDVLNNKKFKDIVSYLNDIQDDQIKEFSVLFKKWKNLIALLLESKYSNKIIDSIRNDLLGGIDKRIMPIKKVVVKEIEIGEKPEHDYLLSIQKLVDPSTISEGDGVSLSKIAFDISDETGEDPVDVIYRLKEEGDERFKCVAEVKKTKHFYDIEIDFWIDYSLVDKEKLKNI